MNDPAAKTPRTRLAVGIAILVSLLGTLPLLVVKDAYNTYHHTAANAHPSELEDLVSSKMAGRLLFNPPENMRQGTHEAVTVRISGNREADLTPGLEHGPKPTIEQIAVMPYMTVRLSGEAFKIKALMPENQFVSEKGFTEWRFDVQAIESGIQSLDLEVGVRAKLKSGTEYSFYPTYERTVTVEVDKGYSFWVFWKENWKWILGIPTAVAVIIKIIMMIFKGKGDAKDKPAEEKEVEEVEDDEGKGTE